MDNKNALTLAQEYNQQGCILHAEAKFSDAIEYYQKAIAEDAAFIEPYINKGSAFAMLEEYGKAKEAYFKALELGQENGTVYFYLGNLEALIENFKESKKYYAKALNQGFVNSIIYLNLAKVEAQENNFKSAISNLDKAILQDKYNLEARLRKAQIYISQKKYNSALEELDLINEINPNVWQGHHYQFLIYIEQGNFLAAENTLSKATKLFPEITEFAVDKMILLEAQKNYSGAIEIIENNLKGINSPALTLEKAKMMLAQERIEESTALLREIVGDSAAEVTKNEALYHLINILISKGDYQEALKFSEEMLSSKLKNSHYFAALYYKPFCFEKLEGSLEAEKEYKNSINTLMEESGKNPGKLEIYLYVAMCLKEVKAYERALQIIEFLLNVNANIAEAYLLRSEIYKELQQHEKAEADRKIAGSKSPLINSMLLLIDEAAKNKE